MEASEITRTDPLTVLKELSLGHSCQWYWQYLTGREEEKDKVSDLPRFGMVLVFLYDVSTFTITLTLKYWY